MARSQISTTTSPTRGRDSRYFSQWRPKQLLEAGRRSDGGNGHFVQGTVSVRSVHGDAALQLQETLPIHRLAESDNSVSFAVELNKIGVKLHQQGSSQARRGRRIFGRRQVKDMGDSRESCWDCAHGVPEMPSLLAIWDADAFHVPVSLP